MLSNLELVMRLVLAAALGSVIGFERERLSWRPACGRTCSSVSVRR